MHIWDCKRLSPRRLHFAFSAVGDSPVNIRDIGAQHGTTVACYTERYKSELCCISTWCGRRVLQNHCSGDSFSRTELLPSLRLLYDISAMKDRQGCLFFFFPASVDIAFPVPHKFLYCSELTFKKLKYDFAGLEQQVLKFGVKIK